MSVVSVEMHTGGGTGESEGAFRQLAHLFLMTNAAVNYELYDATHKRRP